MSYCCVKVVEGMTINGEPTGTIKSNGWLPGTWVKYVAGLPKTYKNSFTMVDICRYGDFPSGFIATGSQDLKGGFDYSYGNGNEKTGRWTADESVQLLGKEHNFSMTFDKDSQLATLGTGSITINGNHEGTYKFYVYEKYNLQWRATGGALGSLLDWHSAVNKNSLYVSNRGILTCEKEDADSIPVARIVADIESDEFGAFILTIGI